MKKCNPNPITVKYNQLNKLCPYRCPTCEILKEWGNLCYQNTAILRDNGEMVHIPKVES